MRHCKPSLRSAWPVDTLLESKRWDIPFSCFRLVRAIARNPFNPQSLIFHLTNSNGCGNLSPGSANVSPLGTLLLPEPSVYPQTSHFGPPFVFIVLQIPSPATPFVSHPYKTPGGVTSSGLPDPFISVLSVPQWQTWSQKNRDGASSGAQFWCDINSFRINTCKSVSKQTTLSRFRINTCEKQGEGEGVRKARPPHIMKHSCA